jgi:uncharacterized membrane protein
VNQPIPFGTEYPLQYIPQLAGVALAKLFRLNFIWLFYLGRLGNLLFYVVCTTIAIKKMPFQKHLVFIIALLPISMQQAASYSYDGFINALSILLVACILHSIYQKGLIRRQEVLWIVVVSALLAPAKVIYFLLTFLVLLIPQERFPDKRSRIRTLAIILGIGFLPILIFSLPRIFSMAEGSAYNWEGGVNYSIADIINNPLHTLFVFANTIRVFGEFYVFSALGQYLSGLSMVLNRWIFEAYGLVLLLACLKGDEECLLVERKHKALLLFASLAIFLLLLLSMFLGWTSNYRDAIEGVQGRYLIPVMLPILLSLRNRIVILHKDIARYLCCFVFLLSQIVLWDALTFTIAKL